MARIDTTGRHLQPLSMLYLDVTESWGMKNLATDVAIIGGGLAGATAAAMLGRAGHNAVLIDPHMEQRPEFRCEKLDDSQLALLRLTGLADEVLPHACAGGQVWAVRFGRLIDRKPNSPAGILYHDLVNAVRQQIPASVQYFATKVTAISNNAAGSRITLASGDDIEARLVIHANGLNPGLRETLEIKREVLSPCHSISIGFDMQPEDGQQFAFPALTVFPEQAGQAMAYPYFRCVVACVQIFSSIGASKTRACVSSVISRKKRFSNLFPRSPASPDGLRSTDM